MCDDIKPPLPDARLTQRERDVLRVWLMEDSKERAARRLYVAASTVATTLERIRHKYSAVDRPARTKAALFARAVQDGLINLNDV